jgi:hypothetical protein
VRLEALIGMMDLITLIDLWKGISPEYDNNHLVINTEEGILRYECQSIL